MAANAHLSSQANGALLNRRRMRRAPLGMPYGPELVYARRGPWHLFLRASRKGGPRPFALDPRNSVACSAYHLACPD